MPTALAGRTGRLRVARVVGEHALPGVDQEVARAVASGGRRQVDAVTREHFTSELQTLVVAGRRERGDQIIEPAFQQFDDGGAPATPGDVAVDLRAAVP